MRAERGDVVAQYCLGHMYSFGIGFNKGDKAKGVQWTKKSAAQGYANAQCVLGTMYADGDGVERDNAKARSWYLKAAEQGDAEAQGLLGVMYLVGEGGPKDEDKGYFWLDNSVESR